MTHPSQDELESLFVNNAELDEISAYLNRFNPIRVMRMEDMEIRHSAILAWLLDPIENHGLGDAFLRAFLAEALRGNERPQALREERSVLTALEVSQADLRDAEIQREKRNIDIFISSPSNDWAFIIENKIHSKQAKGQLKKYLERVKKDAEASVKHQGIFLTLHEEEPDSKVKDEYVTIRYADVYKILGSLMTTNQASMGPEVQQFLNHYIEVIGDATDMNDEQTDMKTLARQLYLSHKKAIDYIMEHGVSTEFTVAVEAVFGEGLDYEKEVKVDDFKVIHVRRTPSEYRFLPSVWVDALGGKKSKPWDGCEKYWAEFPVICWFRLRTNDDGVKGTLELHAEVGPIKDVKNRTNLIDHIQKCAEDGSIEEIRFRSKPVNYAAKTSIFLDNHTRNIEDIGNAEGIEEGMRKLLKDFKPVFEAVEPALKNFAEHMRRKNN